MSSVFFKQNFFHLFWANRKKFTFYLIFFSLIQFLKKGFSITVIFDRIISRYKYTWLYANDELCANKFVPLELYLNQHDKRRNQHWCDLSLFIATIIRPWLRFLVSTDPQSRKKAQTVSNQVTFSRSAFTRSSKDKATRDRYAPQRELRSSIWSRCSEKRRFVVER